jgi:hypothetical protein
MGMQAGTGRRASGCCVRLRLGSCAAAGRTGRRIRRDVLQRMVLLKPKVVLESVTRTLEEVIVNDRD